MGFLYNDVPLPSHQVERARHMRDTKAVVEFHDKKGQRHRALVINVEWRLKPQGIGNGYFVDYWMLDDNALQHVMQDLQARSKG